MNLSAISARSLIGRLLRLPLKLIPRNAVVPILQGRLRGMKWIAGSSNHGYWLGSHELDKRRLFERTVPTGCTVYDLGAHVGYYTLLAARLVGQGGKVYAFEPLPRNLTYLRKHLMINHITNVTVVEAAVSDASGTVVFDEGPSISMGHIASTGGRQVRAVALDDLIASGEAPVPEIIKIDIEGAEFAALRGAQRLLRTAHPLIFLATHGTEVRRQCVEMLEALGYRLQPLDGIDQEHAKEFLAQ